MNYAVDRIAANNAVFRVVIRQHIRVPQRAGMSPERSTF